MSPGPQIAPAGARILIVDDEVDNRELLKIVLGWEGFDCLTAGSGQAALRVALEESPDLILLDLLLPDMDGYAIALQLSANRSTRHIPIIVVSALSDDTTRRRALKAGAVEVLTKPIDRAALSARIREVLSSKSLSTRAELA